MPPRRLQGHVTFVEFWPTQSGGAECALGTAGHKKT